MTQPPRPSGLRDPVRAVRGLGATALAVEAVALLLAIQPLRLVGGDFGGAAVAVSITLAVSAGTLAGLLRRPWAWHAGSILQLLLLLGGLLHWSLGVLGVVFGAVWWYVLRVRRTILG